MSSKISSAASELILLISAAAAAATILILDYYYSDGSPYYGDGGQATYVRFLLNVARPELFREITGIERTTFDRLVLEFEEAALLGDGRSVTVKEQVLMFLDITRYNNSMRQTAVKFRRGLYTVNRYFEEVLEALVMLYPRYVKFDSTTTALHDCIKRNPKMAAFKNCLGAIDAEEKTGNIFPLEAEAFCWAG
ncbi:uncharacterized protein PGTG_10392 [Puccinia graminis f. sp. tritici CRL 75-36-700-3]|uniref:DUF8040 domain-containing protein n=1 Tax=Puccinia graminis f. sp. tritici (strain CRL 75-36-700-3 / race SCCL) TaxID=418459 RepID=E3KKU6_PUCGT|nr:uncharacterized protein PGTG_10392 [Puccinia graminis f. sp. tritici CRL 75-36-700-3]EFP84921.2 hypothetical protein PGTG_10392 [Puccinia graminis f. sp. tritici CRL 75-36-700-3]